MFRLYLFPLKFSVIKPIFTLNTIIFSIIFHGSIKFFFSISCYLFIIQRSKFIQRFSSEHSQRSNAPRNFKKSDSLTQFRSHSRIVRDFQIKFAQQQITRTLVLKTRNSAKVEVEIFRWWTPNYAYLRTRGGRRPFCPVHFPGRYLRGNISSPPWRVDLSTPVAFLPDAMVAVVFVCVCVFGVLFSVEGLGGCLE